MDHCIGVGLMSGTSLDGLDVAVCKFTNNAGYSYELLHGEVIPFSEPLLSQLANARSLSGLELSLLDIQFGKWMGEKLQSILNSLGVQPDFVASHGYTVFHQPSEGLTLQIGSGNEIFAACEVPVICDFRSLDVALRGQGAPLVPIGDKHLYKEYAACLNLGGIANISLTLNGQRLAYDIVPVNMVLNHLAQTFGKSYDEDGILAAQGKINTELLKELESLAYYQKTGPKSLGSEWVNEYITPLLHSAQIDTHDKLCTFVEHIAIQLSKNINKYTEASTKTLATGGGAFNSFLIGRIQQLLTGGRTLQKPDINIIDFKEAIIFAFLGYLKINGQTNTLSSVTGGTRNSSGGIIIDG